MDLKGDAIIRTYVLVLYTITFMQKSFKREVADVFLRVAAVLVTMVLVLFVIGAWYKMEEMVSDGQCNIAVVPVEGVIMPWDYLAEYPNVVTPKSVQAWHKRIEDDIGIKGVLYKINSPGGTPVAAEEISQLIKNTNLPTLSLVGDMGTSGGYLVAAGADTIIASAMSEVGSIGVTMSYTENSKRNEEKGITFVELSTGKFKDAGNPNKPLTDEERAMFEEDLAQVHREFVRQVATLRNLPIEKVEELATGAAMSGRRALEQGLVDQIGGREEARAEFAKVLNLETDQVVFCE